jgi:hypothetical protein
MLLPARGLTNFQCSTASSRGAEMCPQPAVHSIPAIRRALYSLDWSSCLRRWECCRHRKYHRVQLDATLCSAKITAIAIRMVRSIVFLLLLESCQVLRSLSTCQVMRSGVVMFHNRHKVQRGGCVTVTLCTGRVTLLGVHKSVYQFACLHLLNIRKGNIQTTKYLGTCYMPVRVVPSELCFI